LTTWTSRALAVAATSTFGAAIPAAYAVTAQSSLLVTEPGVKIEGSEIYGIAPNPTAYSLGAPASLGTNASIDVSLFDGVGVVRSDAQGTATTTSAASGAVDFKASYQISVLRPEVQPYLPVGYAFNSFWEYDFTPETDAQLTIDYDVDAGVLVGPSFGGWNILLRNGFSTVKTSFVDGVGSFAADLVAGSACMLTLYSPDFTTFDSAVLAAGVETADFRWNIAEAVTAPVPEPATWWLTSAGLLAFAARRRRSAASGR
jgi:hypothetical protein